MRLSEPRGRDLLLALRRPNLLTWTVSIFSALVRDQFGNTGTVKTTVPVAPAFEAVQLPMTPLWSKHW